MPRLPNEKIREAEKLYKSGVKLVDISKKLGVPEGTVRRWKHDKDWDGKSKKKQSERSDNKNDGKANVRKRGAPKGNQNAKGGRGNPNPNTTKHGGYKPVFMDALDEDEQELVGTVPEDEEKLLLEQIQLFSIRERRILKAINKYREMNGEVAVADVSRFEEKRSFKNNEEEAEYDRRQKIKVDKGGILPGKSYNIQTHTTNKDMVIARLEQELSAVQGKKTKAIETLSKLRLEKAKIENENAGNEAVDDWIAAVLGEEVESYE